MKTLGYTKRYVARIYLALGSVLLLSTNIVLAQSTAAGEGALVTLATGSLTRSATESGQRVEPFSRLREGDQISVEKNSRLRLVYFPTGRQETWSGNGRLIVGAEASKASGKLEAQIVQLPDILVRQISKTPNTDGQARAGMTRLRAIASAEQVAKVEATYGQLRSHTQDDDLNPEIYLLASYLELRELDKLESTMRDLKMHKGNTPQAKALLDLYQLALQRSREPAKGN